MTLRTQLHQSSRFCHHRVTIQTPEAISESQREAYTRALSRRCAILVSGVSVLDDYAFDLWARPSGSKGKSYSIYPQDLKKTGIDNDPSLLVVFLCLAIRPVSACFGNCGSAQVCCFTAARSSQSCMNSLKPPFMHNWLKQKSKGWHPRHTRGQWADKRRRSLERSQWVARHRNLAWRPLRLCVPTTDILVTCTGQQQTLLTYGEVFPGKFHSITLLPSNLIQWVENDEDILNSFVRSWQMCFLWLPWQMFLFKKNTVLARVSVFW